MWHMESGNFKKEGKGGNKLTSLHDGFLRMMLLSTDLREIMKFTDFLGDHGIADSQTDEDQKQLYNNMKISKIEDSC